MTAESIDTTVFLRKSYNNIRTRKSDLFRQVAFSVKSVLRRDKSANADEIAFGG